MSGAVLLGLLGCGPVAQRSILPAIGRLANARLTAAFDERAELRQSVARAAPGCRAFESPDAMLAARVVDAIIVGGPVAGRARLAVSALGAGLPVLIEPPIAGSIEEAYWIAEAERAVRLPVMVGFERWWWEPAERLRRTLAAAPASDGEPDVESVLTIQDIDEDLLVALGAHLDLVRHIVDREIASVSARRDAPGEIQAQVSFLGGGAARCRAHSGQQPREQIRVRRGARTYALRSGSGWIRPARGTLRRALDLVSSALSQAAGTRAPAARAYESMIRAFVDRVQTRTHAGPGSPAGIAALLAITALRRSLEEGGVEVRVPAAPGNAPEAS